MLIPKPPIDPERYREQMESGELFLRLIRAKYAEATGTEPDDNMGVLTMVAETVDHTEDKGKRRHAILIYGDYREAMHGLATTI